MSGSLQAWYSLRDLEVLGSRRMALQGELELGKLPRLAAMLHDAAGRVRATLHFRQRTGAALTVELEYETTLTLICQRCLEPFSQPVADRVALALADAEPGGEAPAGYDTVELDDGRLLPARLIEDEIIVAIPLVPKHARVEDCGSLAHAVASQAAKPGAV
jgi:uncharacterized protein